MADMTIEDHLWNHLLVSRGTIPPTAAERGREVVAELAAHGIHKSLGGCLLDKGLIDLEQAKEIAKLVAALSVRCAHCQAPMSLAKVNQHDHLACHRCGAKNAIRLSEGDGPAPERLRAELLEKPPPGKLPAGDPPPERETAQDHNEPRVKVKRETGAVPRISVAPLRKASPLRERMAEMLCVRQHSMIVMGIAGGIFMVSVFCIADRYLSWASEKERLSTDVLCAEAARAEHEALLAERDAIPQGEFHTKATSLVNSYAGTAAAEAVRALLAVENSPTNVDLPGIREAISEGQLALALQRFRDAPAAREGNPELWAELGQIALCQGQLIVVEATADFPGEATRSLSPFLIDVRPITNRSYAEFVRQSGTRPPATWPGGRLPGRMETAPVTGVSFRDARAFASWHGKRLPTEAELRCLPADESWQCLEWVEGDDVQIWALCVRREKGVFSRRRIPVDEGSAEVTFRLVNPIEVGAGR